MTSQCFDPRRLTGRNAGRTRFGFAESSTPLNIAESDRALQLSGQFAIDNPVPAQQRDGVAIVVHEYVRVDDSVVLKRLEEPGDLEDFARQVAAWTSGKA
jgi:hypothetical protein